MEDDVRTKDLPPSTGPTMLEEEEDQGEYITVIKEGVLLQLCVLPPHLFPVSRDADGSVQEVDLI